MINLLRITTVQESLEILLKGQLQFFKEHGYLVSVASAVTNPEKVIELELKEECNHYELPLTRTITPIKDIVAIWKTYLLIKKLKPQIVHTHTPKAGLVGMTAAWLARVPVRLHTVAGLPLMERTGFMKKVLIEVERITYFFATRIYPNSFGLRDYIFDEISKNTKIKVIGQGSSNGINIQHFSKTPELLKKARNIKNELNVKTNDFIWIFVGRVVKDKGVNELVEAFQSFQKQFPNNILLIVGSFEKELDPISYKTELAILNHPNIHFVGFQKDIRPFLCVADVLVFPSYREGFPNVPMQAACMGIPLILTDINGCNELIRDKESGVLITPKNVESIIDAMKLVFHDEKLRFTLALNSQKEIREKFSEDLVWKHILYEYETQLRANKQ